ncbi:MAG: PucR family transcriptional regulator [Actinomycetales bacterium]
MNRVQEVLDSLAGRLGRSLTIDSPDGSVLAYSRAETADPARVAAILQRESSGPVHDWEERHRPSDPTAVFTIPANPDLGMSARLAVPLVSRAQVRGRLLVLGEALTDADLSHLLERAGQLARLLDDVRYDGARPQDRSGSALRDLLAAGPGSGGEQQTRSAVAELASLLPVPVTPPQTPRVVAIALVDPRRRFDEPDAVRAALIDWRQHESTAIGSVLTPQFAVAVRQATGVRTSAGSDPVPLQQFSRHTSRVAAAAVTGLCGPVDLTDLAAAPWRAVTAAELGLLDPALPRPTRWERLGVYRHLVSRPVPETTTGPDPLAGLDAHPLLLETLERYLDTGGNASATAAVLTLHRTSLYYRLDRISELLEVNVGDGLTRLELHLALKQRRCSRRELLSPGPL